MLVFCTITNLVLCHMSKRFAANKMALNLNTISIVKFQINILPQSAVSTGCKENHIGEPVDINVLVFALIATWFGRIPYVTWFWCHAVKIVFHISSSTVRQSHSTCLHSLVKYEIEDLKFLPQCCWRFRCSLVWRCDTGREVSSILKNFSAIVCRPKQSMTSFHQNIRNLQPNNTLPQLRAQQHTSTT